MELKAQRRDIFDVYYSDLERFIQHVYGIEYEILCGEECSNGTSKHYTLKKDEKIDSYDQRDFDKFLAGKSVSFVLRTLMTDMCNRGLIEPGTYYVDCSW